MAGHSDLGISKALSAVHFKVHVLGGLCPWGQVIYEMSLSWKWERYISCLRPYWDRTIVNYIFISFRFSNNGYVHGVILYCLCMCIIFLQPGAVNL